MKKQYFCNPLNMDYRYQFIQDMRSFERLGFGGYGSLGEPPAAGQPAAV